MVLVNGAWQCGKSTLVGKIGADRKAERRNLDRPANREAAQFDPTEFVAGEGMMVIDEVQRVPELLLSIKENVDSDPRPGRFLLTGSARVLGMRALPDALPGRMEAIELWPLPQGEIEGCPDGFIDAIFDLGPELRHASEERRAGNELGLHQTTVVRYVGLLEEVFLIKRIPAWSRNLGSRAVGTSKVAMVDSGVAANLLDQDAGALGQPASPFGPLLEGFVAMEIARQLTWSHLRAELYHYRTKEKVEVDIVLENRRGQVVAIDVKAGSTVRAEDFRGLRHLADRLGDDLIVGAVLYTGQQTLRFGPRFRAIPISALWETSPR